MPLVKFNKIFLNEIEGDKIKKTMMSKQVRKNCIVLYCLSNIFKLSNVIKVSISYIENFFPMVAESENFLELELNYIKKTLSSSGLNIDLELQVFNAVDSWLCHDIIERGKFTNDLFSKVRLPLLSIPALKQVLERVSSKYHEFAKTIEAV